MPLIYSELQFYTLRYSNVYMKCNQYQVLDFYFYCFSNSPYELNLYLILYVYKCWMMNTNGITGRPILLIMLIIFWLQWYSFL